LVDYLNLIDQFSVAVAVMGAEAVVCGSDSHQSYGYCGSHQSSIPRHVRMQLGLTHKSIKIRLFEQ